MCDVLTLSEVSGEIAKEYSFARLRTVRPSKDLPESPLVQRVTRFSHRARIATRTVCDTEVRKTYCDPNTFELHRAKKTRAHAEKNVSRLFGDGRVESGFFSWTREQLGCIHRRETDIKKLGIRVKGKFKGDWICGKCGLRTR